LKIPSEETQERARKVVELWMSVAGAVRDDHLKDVDNWIKHYKVEQGEKSYNGRARTADPGSHENCETIAPRVFNVVTNNGELEYEMEPVDREGDEFVVEAANQLIKADLKMAGAKLKLLGSCRSSVQMGTKVTKLAWEDYYRSYNDPVYSEPKFLGMGDDGIPEYSMELTGHNRKDEIIYSGVNWHHVDLKNVWLDPFQYDVDKAQAIAERIPGVSFVDLERERMKPVTEIVPDASQPVRPDGQPAVKRIKTHKGHYIPKALDELKKKMEAKIKKVAGESETSKDQDKKDTPNPEATLIQYRGWFDYEDNGKPVKCVITLAGDAPYIVLQVEPDTYPSSPYIVDRHIPIPGQTYGLGLLGLMSTMQKLINDMQNQVLDDITQALLPGWKVQEDEDFDDSQAYFAPNKVWKLRDTVNGMIPLKDGIMIRTGLGGIEFAKEAQRQVSGASRSLQSTPMPHSTTATEFQGSVNEADARVVLPAIIKEEEFITRMLQKTLEQNHAFMDDDKLARISNDPELQQALAQIPREEIAGQWDFTPLGASKYVRQQKARRDWNEYSMTMSLSWARGEFSPPVKVITFAPIFFRMGRI